MCVLFKHLYYLKCVLTAHRMTDCKKGEMTREKKGEDEREREEQRMDGTNHPKRKQLWKQPSSALKSAVCPSLVRLCTCPHISSFNIEEGGGGKNINKSHTLNCQKGDPLFQWYSCIFYLWHLLSPFSEVTSACFVASSAFEEYTFFFLAEC